MSFYGHYLVAFMGSYLNASEEI
ncbi:MAG: hypothetical protein JEY91_17750 [Spirochaetaceae bacterium]|nr:hypothetical protein [Spirochaetaceae bacterium]